MGRKEDEDDARKARERAQRERDAAIQKRLDDEAELEDLERMSDTDMDLETMQIIADLGIKADEFDKILNTKYDDADVQRSIDEVNAAKKKWTQSGRQKATKRAVKKNKKNLKKANKKKGGCAVVAISMIAGVTSLLSAVGWGTYEVVSRLI